MEDKRKHKRVPFEANAEVKNLQGLAYGGMSRNIGFGGIYIELSEEHMLEIGETCSVVVYLSDNDNPVMDFNCSVIHLREKCSGVGINFNR